LSREWYNEKTCAAFLLSFQSPRDFTGFSRYAEPANRMKLFVDTANLHEITRACEWRVLDCPEPAPDSVEVALSVPHQVFHQPLAKRGLDPFPKEYQMVFPEESTTR
jgi:hypothetical protein